MSLLTCTKSIEVLRTEDAYYTYSTRHWEAGNAKRVAEEIGYVEKLNRPETTKYETNMTGSDTGARSVVKDMEVEVENHYRVKEASKYFVRGADLEFGARHVEETWVGRERNGLWFAELVPGWNAWLGDSTTRLVPPSPVCLQVAQR